MIDIKNVSKQLGETLLQKVDNYHQDPTGFTDLKEVMIRAFQRNGWFTEANIINALEQWSQALSQTNIENWLAPYGDKLPVKSPKTVGVINAGNIPFVGFHDLLSILIAGHNYIGKNASDDQFLLPWIANLMIEIEPSLKEKIKFVEKLEKMDAVIATGSNNSSRYFEYYFSKYPHIIRKNRNGVAVLSGLESKEQLTALGKDIFTYFGLGCRNVSKIYVPRDYVFDPFFEAIFEENTIMNNTKYMNNFDYNNSVLLLKLVPFLQNGFLIIHEDERIPSPISIVHYERYDDLEKLNEQLVKVKEELQCLVCDPSVFHLNDHLKKLQVNFGQTQSPQLWDYADGVDTLEYLSSF